MIQTQMLKKNLLKWMMVMNEYLSLIVLILLSSLWLENKYFFQHNFERLGQNTSLKVKPPLPSPSLHRKLCVVVVQVSSKQRTLENYV